jgi:Fe(3+) dicitrate transport protein
MKLICTLLLFHILAAGTLPPNASTIRGYIKHDDTAMSNVNVTLDAQSTTVTNSEGFFEFKNVTYGFHTISATHAGYKIINKKINVNADLHDILLQMEANPIALEKIVVVDHYHFNGMERLNSVEGTAIYAAKKNEVINMDGVNANLATNNPRQIFEKVPGLNVWENDGSGIQMNVGTRGLSPNRSWEFNVRQNDYNIQADVLGYPDSYYTPPAEAISSIELIRGAASLQYGTQFGGLLNFVLKKSSGSKPFELENRQTYGSFNMFNSYTSIGGKKNKWSYFGYVHHRSADGWRQNSDYRWNTGYASINYAASDKLKISFEFTAMNYRLHLSAGATDSMFNKDARISIRGRNWFDVTWNVPALTLQYNISDATQLKVTSFMLIASRKSIENTTPVNIIPDVGNRDIRVDEYLNAGIEARLMHNYQLFRGNDQKSSFSFGMRAYRGRTERHQGLGTDGREADFQFINPGKLEYNDYDFITSNFSAFAENLFKIGKKLSFVPGIRYELIKFGADGYYNSAGTLIYENDLESKRSFPMLGTGLEYAVTSSINAYSNISQAYRSINFNDIRITSPNLIVDKDLKDSRGYNMDIGIRGRVKEILNFDVSWFLLMYNDRIGVLSGTDQNGNPTLTSTNIADSKNQGLESFAEVNILKLLSPDTKNKLFVFGAYSYVNARYVSSKNKTLHNKKVEFVPQNILRSGITFKTSFLSTSLSMSSLSSQFSDANNTISSATGNNGIVPAYQVWDWTINVNVKMFKAGCSVNNITNEKYFTRRSTAYPGPGLIPADPRNFNVFLGVKL